MYDSKTKTTKLEHKSYVGVAKDNSDFSFNNTTDIGKSISKSYILGSKFRKRDSVNLSNMRNVERSIALKRGMHNFSHRHQTIPKNSNFQMYMGGSVQKLKKGREMVKNLSVESIHDTSLKIPNINATKSKIYKRSERETVNLSPVYSNVSGHKNLAEKHYNSQQQ